MFPGDAAALGVGPHFENQWSSGLGQGRLCSEFQLLGLLPVGTLPCLIKACVRSELTFPLPPLHHPFSSMHSPVAMCKRIR